MCLCVHIKLIYDNLKTSCVCALAVSNINYYRNFIEYRHESVELVWCDSCTCGVTKEEQIIQSGYFNCIVNWNVKSIVNRDWISINTCKSIFNQGMDSPHRIQLCGNWTQASRVTLSRDPPLDYWGHHLIGLQGRHSLL